MDYIIYHFLVLYEYRMLFLLYARATFSYFDVQYTILKVHDNCSSQFNQDLNIIHTSLWNATDYELNVIINELYYSNIYIHGTRRILFLYFVTIRSLYTIRASDELHTEHSLSPIDSSDVSYAICYVVTY